MLALFKQYTQASLVSIGQNKVRSFLTMLGIIIGVAAVIIIMAIGNGAQSLILSQIETLGTNKLGIFPGKSEDGPPTSVMGIVITTLTYEDAMAIRKDIPSIREIVAYSNEVTSVKWRSESYITSVKGCTTGYLEVEDSKVETGHFFTERQEENMARVAVMGSAAKKELFGPSQAVGETIKIKNHPFRVIGVMEKRGTVAFQDYDDQILVPIKSAQKLIKGVDYVNLIRAEVENEDKMERAQERIEALLRDRHDIEDRSGASDDFTVQSSAEALEIINTVTDAIRYFLIAMAALSLLVGGIGIMNIMLVNVTERTKEVGLRKAIGARNSDIAYQFLIETMIITFLGGLIGMIIGIVFSWLIAIVINQLGYYWEFSISPLSIVAALGVSAGIGLVFGLYPAQKAAELTPLEALRYE